MESAIVTSPHLQMVKREKVATTLCFHSLRGNLFLVEPKDIACLESFSVPRRPSARELSSNIFRDLLSVNFLTKVDTNERSFFAQRNNDWMSKVPNGGQVRLLNLMISEACNFGCKHCLHRCSVQTQKTHGKKKLMSWEIAKRAIDEYSRLMIRFGISKYNVHFGSAEPLLNWLVLKKAILYVRKLSPKAQIAVNTNLSLLSREMGIFFRDYGVSISTSLDGPIAGNDAIRTFANGKGTYGTIVSKFELLSSIGYPLDGFSITINDLNFEAVTPEFVEWAHGYGFKGVATDIDLINTTNSSRSVGECLNKLMEIRHACQKKGLENFGSWTTAYYNLVNEPEDGMPTFCKAVKGRNVSVNPSGTIFVCGHTNSKLGELDQFEEIFRPGSPYVEMVRSRLPGNDPMCFGCEIEGVCAGQCQITREISATTGNSKDSTLCQFYRMATKKLLEEKLEKETVAK